MENISNWAQGIIIAVIIGTIIEMILPKNSTGKYVKVVIGLFILFSIIAPVLGDFSGNKFKIDTVVNKYAQLDEISTSNLPSEDLEDKKNKQIKNIYKQNLELDIQTKIQMKGYKTDNVNAYISNDDQYTIEKIEFTITEKNEEIKNQKQAVTLVDNIESIKISSSNKNKKDSSNSIITENERKNLKKYLSETYDVPEKNINII